MVTTNAKLTTTIELSEISDFLKFQVDLNDIPITTKQTSEFEDKLNSLDQM